MIESLENVRVEVRDGRHFIAMDIDGEYAEIHYEQRLLRWGGVNVGPWFVIEEKHRFVIPADPGEGRPSPEVAYGVVNDSRVTSLARYLIEGVNNRTIKPGPLKGVI